MIQLCEGTCEGPGMCETKAMLKLTSRLSGFPPLPSWDHDVMEGAPEDSEEGLLINP